MAVAIGKSAANKAAFTALAANDSHYEALGRAVGRAVAQVERTAADRAARFPPVKPAGTVGELASRLGGTKAVAEQLGVAQRTVERYIAKEQGKSSQQRGFGRTKSGESVADKFKAAAKSQATQATRELRKEAREQARADVKRDMKANGASSKFSGKLGYSQTVWNGNLDEHIDPEAMSDVLDALDQGEYPEAGRAYEAGLGDAYQLSGMEIYEWEAISF